MFARKKKKSGWKSRPIKTKKPKKTKHLFKGFVVLFASILILVSVFAGIFLAWLNYNLPSPEKLLERVVAQSTKIYDRTGKTPLYEIFSGQRRTLIKISDIPPNLIYATLSIEDKDFFSHPGFDLKAIVRAVLIDILKGGKLQGASTITQQFIKTAFLTPQKTWQRKIKEVILAYQIEKKYSKQEILQMYFNEIPYGSNAYGVEAASQIYFNKSARDLTLDESATLAALTKAPSYYSPYGDNKEELIARRDLVLSAMAEQGFITQELAEQTKKIDTLKNIAVRYEDMVAPHFIMYIKNILAEKYGEKLVEQGGLKVITSLDLNKQTIAEETIKQYSEKNSKTFKATNASLVSIDVNSGEILAMVGSINFFDESIDGQVNVATRPRQPGSSFKPIVYATAFEKGFTPQTLLFDVETNFGPSGQENKDYIPQNYDGKFRGPVTLRQALAGSLNIPAIKTLYLTGISDVLNLSQKFGYTTLIDKNRYGLSLVLGGAEVKLLEHTAAYGVFAREGKKIPTISILKIEDSDGNILEQAPETPLAQKVVSPQTARLINDILSDNQARSFIFGEQNFLTLSDRPVAAKTGTTNNFRDAWIIGYTPSLVTGVWVGNSRNEAMAKGADGSKIAAPIWQTFMKNALGKTSPEKFNPPESIETDKPVLRGELPSEINLKIDRASNKLATDLTPLSQIVEKKFKQYHSILYYINKDAPLGPPPENPANDPQYNRWEKGIKMWVEKLTKESSDNLTIAPVEYDDLHIPANQPKINIFSPSSGALVSEETLEIKVESSAPRGLAKITCAIDNITAGIILIRKDSSDQKDFSCNLNLAGLASGEHKITATAYDDIDNSKNAEIWIIIGQTFEQKIIWLDHKSGEIFEKSDFPIKLSVLAPAVQIKTIRFFSKNISTAKISLLGTIFDPETGSEINFNWEQSENGIYSIWPEIITVDNQTILGSEIEVEIK